MNRTGEAISREKKQENCKVADFARIRTTHDWNDDANAFEFWRIQMRGMTLQSSRAKKCMRVAERGLGTCASDQRSLLYDEARARNKKSPSGMANPDGLLSIQSVGLLQVNRIGSTGADLSSHENCVHCTSIEVALDEADNP